MGLCFFRMREHKKKNSNHHHPGGTIPKSITDASVEHFLHDPHNYALFLKWAVDNLCSENLFFYVDVENFKNIQNEEEAKKEAERIYHRYIEDDAEMEVNLGFESKKEVRDGLQNPSRNMFDQSQYTVHELIKYDLLSKFLDSDDYRATQGLPTLHKSPYQRKNKVEDMPRLTTESVQKLEVCLSNPIAREEFLIFTKKEFSAALPLFYLEVEKFQRQPSQELAVSIFQKYLGKDSEDEVDADPRVKKIILQNIEAGNIQPDMFDKLQVQVFSCMAQDNFFRFQKYMISRLAVL